MMRGVKRSSSGVSGAATSSIIRVLQELDRGAKTPEQIVHATGSHPSTFYRQLAIAEKFGVIVFFDKNRKQYRVSNWGVFSRSKIRQWRSA